MELSKIEFGKGCDAAICVKSTGEAPKQTLNFDELMKKEVPVLPPRAISKRISMAATVIMTMT